MWTYLTPRRQRALRIRPRPARDSFGQFPIVQAKFRSVIGILSLLAIPALYAAVLVYLARKGDARGIGISILFFALTFATGFWSITQSRSSTAGIGFIFLPLMATVGGFFGLAFGRWRTSHEPARKVLGWLAIGAAVLILFLNVREGFATRIRNQGRDDNYAAHAAAIARNQKSISASLEQNRGREGAFLDSSIRANRNDRTFLIAALPNDSISPALLDTLANHPDRGIASMSVGNPGTRAETLSRIYRQKKFPDYFYQTLAAHRNSPPDVLRGIYRNPGVMSNLDIWLAGNPGTPRDILELIAKKTTDRWVIGRMMENPTMDCGLLGELGTALLRRIKSGGGDPNVVRMTELLPKLCPSGKPA